MASGKKQQQIPGTEQKAIPRIDELVEEVIGIEERAHVYAEKVRAERLAKLGALEEELTKRKFFEDAPYIYVDGAERRKVYVRRDEKVKIGKPAKLPAGDEDVGEPGGEA